MDAAAHRLVRVTVGNKSAVARLGKIQLGGSRRADPI